jgi:hypothetical protein
MSLNDTVNDAGLSAMDTLPKERLLTPQKRSGIQWLVLLPIGKKSAARKFDCV